MLPLVKQLTPALAHPCLQSSVRNLGNVEPITTPLRFTRDPMQIRGDRFQWLPMHAKSSELWMPCIPARFSFEHLLRKQRFAPRGREAFHIQITRVHRPKSHPEILRRTQSSVQLL